MKNKQKSLKLNAFFNVIKSISSILFPLITFPYISRTLMPKGVGSINFANSIVSYFLTLAGLGVNSYGIRGVAQNRNDKIKLSKFVKELFILNIISTLISYILLFIGICFIPKFNDNKILIIICGASILLTTIGMDWLYSGLEEYGYITLRSVFFQLISLILMFIFVKQPEDYIKYAAIGVISSSGANIINLIYSRKYVKIFNKYNINIAQHLKPVLILFASSLAVNIFTTLDTSMLGFITDKEQVGYYAAASKINRMIRDIFPAITGVLYARLSYYVSIHEEKKINSIINNTLNFLMCMTLPVVIGLFILMEPIILILCGEQYKASISAAHILTPLIIFSAFSSFMGGQIIMSFKKEKIYLYVMITATIGNIILNYILIPKYLINGASLATTLSELFIFICYFVFTKKIINYKIYIIPFIKYLMSAIVMGVIIYFVQKPILNNTLKLIITIPTGIIIYAIMLYILKSDFYIAEINNIINKIKR